MGALLVALVVSPVAVDPLTLNTWLALARSSSLGLTWLLGTLWLHPRVRREEVAQRAAAADVLLEEDPARSRESPHAIEETAGLWPPKREAVSTLVALTGDSDCGERHGAAGGHVETTLL